MSEKTQEKIVRAGVAVFVVRSDGKYLLMKRRGAHGAGTWGLPGGHIEFGETAVAAARREVLEETGIEVGEVERLGWSEAVFREVGKHYVTALMRAMVGDAEGKILEPEKCDELRWVALGGEPEPLFAPLKDYLDNNSIGFLSDATR